MDEVMVAVFANFSDALSVSTELIREGFPTGQVELTFSPQRAADLTSTDYERYFAAFFDQTEEWAFVQELARHVSSGRIATLAVRPRDDLETSRATEILENQGALQVDPDEVAWVHAGNSPGTSSWLDHLIPEHAGAGGRFCFRSVRSAIR